MSGLWEPCYILKGHEVDAINDMMAQLRRHTCECTHYQQDHDSTQYPNGDPDTACTKCDCWGFRAADRFKKRSEDLQEKLDG